MTGSKMRFSRSGHDPGIIRPWYPTEPPHALTAGESHKHAGWPRHAQRVVQFALSAGCHPPEWPPPYERPEHGHHRLDKLENTKTAWAVGRIIDSNQSHRMTTINVARAERAGRDWVGLSST